MILIDNFMMLLKMCTLVTIALVVICLKLPHTDKRQVFDMWHLVTVLAVFVVIFLIMFGAEK